MNLCPEVLFFDINETLLDLRALEPDFVAIFGDPKSLNEWFALTLQYSLVSTVTERYFEFTDLARATLQMLAKSRNVPLSDANQLRVIDGLKSMPPHPEVPDALERLSDAGFRMAALSNSAPSALESQLRNSDLAQYFEQIISVGPLQRFKPHPSVYRTAAAHMKVSPSLACLVAAHAWDLYGAMNAGLTAAFIRRPGKTLFPLAPEPMFNVADLTELAVKLADMKKPRP